MLPLSRRRFLAASAAVLAGPLPVRADDAPKKLVLLAGKPSHGPGAHEFNAGVGLLKQCLDRVKGLEVVAVKDGWPDNTKVFDGAAGVLCYADGGPGHPFVQGTNLGVVRRARQEGGRLDVRHYGVEVEKAKAGQEFMDWIGGYYESGYSCNPMWTPDFKELPKHPIANGVRPFAIKDEWYFGIRFRPDLKGVTPILTATPPDDVRDGPYVYPKGPYKHVQERKGQPEHMMWCVERDDGGRGVGFTGGHFHANWQDDNFRKVVLNALAWVCKLDVPEKGIESAVTADDMTKNLDPKGKK